LRLPADHPLRETLNQEIHARPPEAISPPAGVAYLVMLSPPDAEAAEREHVADLLEARGVEAPERWTNHFSSQLPDFLLKWERHTEFSRYTIIGQGADAAARPETLLERVGDDWVVGLPGELMFAAKCSVLEADPDGEEAELAAAAEAFGSHVVGADLSGGAVRVFSDFDIQQDHSNLFLLYNRSANRMQLGRVVQRVLELNTYWIMALLALPAARALHPYLSRKEAVLQTITQALVEGYEDDARLLDELTELEAEFGRQAAENAFRFSASSAYHQLVVSRVRDLRERRIPGLQTFAEFTERRLAPAMNTCTSAEARLVSLLERASQTTRLIATRVGMAQERQNQSVLESMDRRARLQLRLQQTVEGLSVAAITYYVVGLVKYAAESAHSLGLPMDAKLITGISIPIVALLVGFAVTRVRRHVTREQ